MERDNTKKLALNKEESQMLLELGLVLKLEPDIIISRGIKLLDEKGVLADILLGSEPEDLVRRGIRLLHKKEIPKYRRSEIKSWLCREEQCLFDGGIIMAKGNSRVCVVGSEQHGHWVRIQDAGSKWVGARDLKTLKAQKWYEPER